MGLHACSTVTFVNLVRLPAVRQQLHSLMLPVTPARIRDSVGPQRSPLAVRIPPPLRHAPLSSGSREALRQCWRHRHGCLIDAAVRVARGSRSAKGGNTSKADTIITTQITIIPAASAGADDDEYFCRCGMFDGRAWVAEGPGSINVEGGPAAPDSTHKPSPLSAFPVGCSDSDGCRCHHPQRPIPHPAIATMATSDSGHDGNATISPVSPATLATSECGAWGCSCQGFSDRFDTRPFDWGRVAAVPATEVEGVKRWWWAHRCRTSPATAPPRPR